MKDRARRFKYHVFVSYSHRDEAWVTTWLVPRLKRAGLRVCLDSESFAPGASSITEIERAVLESRKTLLVLTPSYLRSQWTEFENVLVQTVDPNARSRRLIPLLVRRCEMPLRLRALVYVDFRRRAEHRASLTRVLTAIRRGIGTARMASSRRTLGAVFDVPTGALLPTSPLYVEREGDGVVREQIVRGDNPTIVIGARQMGKTSLLARVITHARRRRLRVVDVDFQAFEEAVLADLDTLLRHLAYAFERQLGIAGGVDEIWASGLSVTEKLTAFLEDHVLSGRGPRVVLILDEADRVFGRAYQHDFFGLLRSWHNARATRPAWRGLNLVLAISGDPTHAIRDPSQSPFNVGTRITLADFSPDQVGDLNRRWGRPLNRAEVGRLVRFIGGHPYLVQAALHALARGTHTFRALLDVARAEQGPFAEHLLRYRHAFDRDERLRLEMRRALTTRRCAADGAFRRLRAIGLLKGRDHTAVTPRCRLYDGYFSSVLS